MHVYGGSVFLAGSGCRAPEAKIDDGACRIAHSRHAELVARATTVKCGLS
jgi:hypothetical protein